MAAVRIRITGKVQGVGFRSYVMRLAREYHLRGEVYNVADGSVQGVFESENAGNIDRAVQLLRKGPGEVENVESNAMAADPGHNGFAVSYSRHG